LTRPGGKRSEKRERDRKRQQHQQAERAPVFGAHRAGSATAAANTAGIEPIAPAQEEETLWPATMSDEERYAGTVLFPNCSPGKTVGPASKCQIGLT